MFGETVSIRPATWRITILQSATRTATSENVNRDMLTLNTQCSLRFIIIIIIIIIVIIIVIVIIIISYLMDKQRI